VSFLHLYVSVDLVTPVNFTLVSVMCSTTQAYIGLLWNYQSAFFRAAAH